MQSLDMDELVNDVAAATYLKTTRQTLANWRSTKRHSLPYVKIGSLVRYRRQDLERFVQQQTVAGGN
jgi:excisionase family DNA binding protein